MARETAPMMPRRVEARGLSSGPEIFGSCRSKAAEDQGIVSFQKLWADLHSFEWLNRWSSLVYGGAWRRVTTPLLMIFLGFVHRGPLDRMVALVL